MVGPGSIISCTFRGIISYKYAACICNLFCYRIAILCRDYQMLRCIYVCDFAQHLFLRYNYNTAVFRRLQNIAFPSQLRYLSGKEFRDLFSQCSACCNQNGLAFRTVFQLGYEVCSDKLRVCAFICQYHHFGWACRHVDCAYRL